MEGEKENKRGWKVGVGVKNERFSTIIYTTFFLSVSTQNNRERERGIVII